MWRTAYAVLACALAVPAGFAADERGVEDVERELAEARAQIAKLTGRIKILTQEQTSLSREIQLREAERQIALGRLSEATLILREAERRRLEAAVLADQARASLERARAALQASSRAAYRVGPATLVRAALAAEHGADLFFCFELMGFMARRSALAAERYDAYAVASAALQEELRVRAEAARVASVESEIRRREAAEARDRAKLALERVLSEREAGEQLLTERVEDARRLEKLLLRLGAAPEAALPMPEADSILTAKGLLPWPAVGPIVTTFGRHKHPRFQTFTTSSGVDIGAPLRASVRAVYRGRVVYASWFQGYGNLVILDHGDKVYTLYAHVDDVAVRVGDDVMQGQPIAIVSDTGSIAGVSLYFEVRRGAEAVDPLDWLERARPR